MIKFEIVHDDFRKHPDLKINLPQRGTKYSAGYDFETPIKVTILPKTKCLIWTDIKAIMTNYKNPVLKLYPRSSLGIKKGLMLANIVGIIDQDYANNPSNDGNIGICLYNYGEETVELEAGEKIVQGIFEYYMTTIDDNCENERIGGIGSTT